MRTTVPEKIIEIIDDIETRGNVPLTRLTVLKGWLKYPGRLPALGLWIARRSAGRKGKTIGEYGALLREASALLGPAPTGDRLFGEINRPAAEAFHARARDSQNEYQDGERERVRDIRCRQLFLVEEGLAVYLWHADSPDHGYQLAADWAQNHDRRHGNGLNGPSRGKLEELVRFMFTVEALEPDR